MKSESKRYGDRVTLQTAQEMRDIQITETKETTRTEDAAECQVTGTFLPGKPSTSHTFFDFGKERYSFAARVTLAKHHDRWGNWG